MTKKMVWKKNQESRQGETKNGASFQINYCFYWKAIVRLRILEAIYHHSWVVAMVSEDYLEVRAFVWLDKKGCLVTCPQSLEHDEHFGTW